MNIKDFIQSLFLENHTRYYLNIYIENKFLFSIRYEKDYPFFNKDAIDALADFTEIENIKITEVHAINNRPVMTLVIILKHQKLF